MAQQAVTLTRSAPPGAAIELVEAVSDRDRFSALVQGEFSGRNGDPIYGLLADRYFPHVFGGTARDGSFILVIGGRPCLLCQASVIDGRCAHYGFPARILVSENLPQAERDAALRRAVKLVRRRAEAHDAHEIHCLETGETARLGPDAMAWLAEGAAPRLAMTAVTDLTLSEKEIHGALRKSYKSLVNWGRRHLDLKAVDRTNPDRGAFEDYRAFHRRIAGKVTRAAGSWEAMFALMRDGHGELLLGYLDGDLVSGTMIADGLHQAIYMSAVYDRERFDKPLGHWPLYAALLRAKGRGLRAFELGDVPVKPAPATIAAEPEAEKAYAVGQFKKGFATHIQARRVWRWQKNGPAG